MYLNIVLKGDRAETRNFREKRARLVAHQTRGRDGVGVKRRPRLSQQVSDELDVGLVQR